MQLTDDDYGQLVTIGVGDELTVTLAANPTTGHRWEVGALDARVLAARGPSQYVPASPAIGSGGKEILSFRGNERGRTELKLCMRRPFERSKPAAKEFNVTVIVA